MWPPFFKGPVWCVQPAEAGPPHSLHIKALYCLDCLPPFFWQQQQCSPSWRRRSLIRRQFYCVVMFHKESRCSEAVWHCNFMDAPKAWKRKVFSFHSSQLFFLLLARLLQAAKFSWVNIVGANCSVVLCLVQILFGCQDAVPHRPWRKCCGRAEKKESFEALCKLYPLSLFSSCSCSSRSPVQSLCIVSVEI